MLPQSPSNSSAENLLLQVPDSFDEFVVSFESYIRSMKYTLQGFLWARDAINIVVDAQSETFSYSPLDNRICVPVCWLFHFYESLKRWSSEDERERFLYSVEDLKFWLFHELSHFRDMLKEKSKSGKNSMLTLLTGLKKQKIKFWDDREIPIGVLLHRIFNCVDDVVVNREVENFIGSGIDQKHLQGFYMYNLFPDVVKKPGGPYCRQGDRICFVGEGKGNLDINDTKEVDYSDKQLSGTFWDYLLRREMIKSQKILLPEKLQNILFSNADRNKANAWNTSLKRLLAEMESSFAEVSGSGTVEEKRRAGKLKSEYFVHMVALQSLLDEPREMERLLYQCVLRTNGTNRYIAQNLSILDLVRLFTVSSGRDDNHELSISPALRYRIYTDLLIPIQKGLILIDLLKQDIKEEKNKKKTSTTEDGGDTGKSGNQAVHESPDIDEKLRIIEELNQQQENQEEKELAKKQADEVNYDVTDILTTSGVGKLGMQALETIISENQDIIKDLVEFFLEQLKALDTAIDVEEHFGRKGKINTNKVREYLTKDPEGTKIYEKRLYEKKLERIRVVESIKNVDLTFAVDISGSMTGFKGPKGMLNIITTAVYIAFKHIEANIRNLIGDPNYTISIHYVMYGSGLPATSYDSQYANAIDSVKMAELNEKIMILDGGTNDATAWKKIAHEFDRFLWAHKEYVQELGEGRRKSVILQIADTDVTENGVEILQKTFGKYITDPSILETLPFKRIILGNMNYQTMTRDEYAIAKTNGTLGNWDPVFLPDGRVQLKQISIKSKREIVNKVKELFMNFFVDFTVKK